MLRKNLAFIFIFFPLIFSIGFSSFESWSNEFNVTGQLGAPNNFPHRFTINGSASCAFNDARDLFCATQDLSTNLSIYRLNNTWNYSSSGINTTVFARSNETWFRCFCNNPSDSNQAGHDDPINAFSLYANVWVMTSNQTNRTNAILDLKYEINASMYSAPGVKLIVTNGLLCSNFTGISSIVNASSNYRVSAPANFTWSAWYQAWNGGLASGQRRFYGEPGSGNWFADLGTPGTGNNCPDNNYYAPKITMYATNGSNVCLDTGNFSYGAFFHLSLHEFSNNMTIAMNGSINQTINPKGVITVGNTNTVAGQSITVFGLSGSVCELIRVSTNGNQWLAPFEANLTYYLKTTRSPVDFLIASLANPSNNSYSLSPVNLSIYVRSDLTPLSYITFFINQTPSYCMQPQANGTHPCSGYANTTDLRYSGSGTGYNSSWYDQDVNSYTLPSSGSIEAFTNWSVPYWATIGSIFEIRAGSTTITYSNLTLPTSCLYGSWNTLTGFVGTRVTLTEGGGTDTIQTFCLDSNSKWLSLENRSGSNVKRLYNQRLFWLIGANHTNYTISSLNNTNINLNLTQTTNGIQYKWNATLCHSSLCNSTGLLYFTTGTAPGADSCTYAGTGVWTINIYDNCTLTSDKYVDNELRIVGTSGTLTIRANITAKRIAMIPSSFTQAYMVAIEKAYKASLGVIK